ncbi:hypothetical protein ES708_09717 [subsurface metagenome]|jgi:vacuolar-type H+-ATPase subunit I/STV1
MTEENKSVLKTKLGLENLKGLGDTLKQIKEVNESLVEAQKTVSELAKDNSPLGRALARLVEAQGLKTLNENNINVSEEVRKNMAEELKNKDKTIEELGTENKGLKEDKVISEVTSKLTTELDQRLPKPGAPGTDGSGQGKLFKAIEDVVAKKLEQLLGGSNTTLTSEQIRTVVKEEVGAVAGGNKKPEDMVDDLVNALTIGDKLREKLGVPGIGGRLLQENQGGDSGLRTDLVKALLEDERERLRMTQNHEVEVERNKHIGTVAATVKENLGDGIAAISAAVKETKESSGAGTPATQQQQTFECGDCHTKFSPPAGWEGQPLKCPNPACGREYTKEELLE